MNPIPYGKQEITNEDIEAVVATLKSDYLTQGPKIPEFEKAYAEYVGSKFAVAVSNGTAALHLSVLALGLKPGERVITTPITFVASANCVLYAGGEVDFVDIDEESYLMDLNKLREKLASKPRGYYKGVIPVDFAGYPVNLEELKFICDEFDLWIVEDACHAPGGYFVDSKNIKQKCGNGNFANTSIFSFHPVKHIAVGEGGMITTNDEGHYKKLLRLRTHGITKNKDELTENQGSWYHEMQDLGFNYRLTDFQSALGLSQLNRINENLEKRNEIAARYREELKELPIRFQRVSENSFHAYHLMIIEYKNRKELFEYLHGRNILCQVHYIPVYKHPYYRNNGYSGINLNNAEKYYKQCISLPLFPSLKEDELDYVINSIKSFFDASKEDIY